MNRKARVARCYTDQTLQSNTEVVLDKRSGHHLSTVLRARKGQFVQLFNNDGKNYPGEIITTGKNTTIRLYDATDNPLESSLQLTLVQAIARGDKMDTIVRAATELGVSAVQPIYTRHSIAKLDAGRAVRKNEHWQSIAISACEQSGRSTLPVIAPIQSLSEYLISCDQPKTAINRWILSPTATPLSTTATSLSQATIMIGPESGFDADELLACEAKGFTALQLGPRVLRTETAGPAAIAILQMRFGDIN